VIFVAAIDTQEFRLSLSILYGYMAAGRARLACVLRRYGQQYAAVPLDFVVELSSELTPSLIENGTV
jgi:hypothetical protein